MLYKVTHYCRYAACRAVEHRLTNENTVLYPDGIWRDYAAEYLGAFNELYIFPIVQQHIHSVGVGNGITKNELTFYGSYPNPAVNNTNIRFSLATSATITVTVTDINGRTVKTITQNNMPPGEHTIAVETADMPSGEYIYIIHTSSGNGFAGKMSVTK